MISVIIEPYLQFEGTHITIRGCLLFQGVPLLVRYFYKHLFNQTYFYRNSYLEQATSITAKTNTKQRIFKQ